MLNKRILILVSLVAFLTLLTGCLTPPNQAPILTSYPITTATVGVEYVYNVNATDPNSDILAYSLAAKPSGMTINSANGLIKWTPTAKGNSAVIVKISDGDLDITQSFTIVVTEPPNQAPIASFTASPVSGEVPLGVSFNASNSSDSDGSIISYEWDFKDGNTGSGETISHTFVSAGSYNVELTIIDNDGATDSTTKTIITNEIVYRALCVGVGDYIYGDDDDDLYGPPYDVDRMIQIFNQCRFGPSDTEFSTINDLKDWQATRSNILQGIASTFSGADDYDVSYFYYSGHGYRGEGTSYLCPADSTSISSFISVDELENALSAIPGTKVVILDTCYSGGFIGKGKGEIIISQEELESFNNEIINVFFQAESKGLLTTNQYKVLTACHHYHH
ncbi:PKD domain-containing protein, partial [Candidatus Atribacteria bacterium 1244-E10-H5-B2]